MINEAIIIIIMFAGFPSIYQLEHSDPQDDNYVDFHLHDSKCTCWVSINRTFRPDIDGFK